MAQVLIDVVAQGNAWEKIDALGADYNAFVNKTTAANAQLAASSDKSAGAVKRMKNENMTLLPGLERASESITSFATANAGLISIFVAVALAVKKVFETLFEWGELAAGNERLMESGRLMATSYGQSMDTIVAKVREASLNTVSDMDIIKSANKAMMLGVSGSASQLANLMEIAAFKGRAMGISTTQAFDDMTRGVGRMSPMILDNLGIIVDAETTYKDYAESVGKATSDLTRQEKQQALLTKVLKEGNAQLAAAGGLADDGAAAYERLTAAKENFKNVTAAWLGLDSRAADSVANLLSSETRRMQFYVDVKKALEAGNITYLEYASIVTDFSYRIIDVATAEKELHDATGETVSIMYESRLAVSEGRDAIAGMGTAAVLTAEEIDAMDKALQAANKNTIDSAIELTKKNKDFYQSQEDIKRGISELEAEKAKVYPGDVARMDEINAKIDEQKQKYTDSAIEFKNSMTEKLAMMTIEKIAMEDGVAGFSAAEMEKAQAVLKTLGVVSGSALDEQLAMEKLSAAVADGKIPVEALGEIMQRVMADGVISAGEVASAINSLPDHTIKVNVEYSDPGSGRTYLRGGRALGGPVTGGVPVIVGENGPEVFMPNSNGQIIPNNKLGNFSGGTKAGGAVNVYLNVASAVSIMDKARAQAELMPFILQGIRQAQANGMI